MQAGGDDAGRGAVDHNNLLAGLQESTKRYVIPVAQLPHRSAIAAGQEPQIFSRPYGVDGLVAVSGDISESVLLAPLGTRGDGNNEVMSGADEVAIEIVELAQYSWCGLITER